MTIIFVVVFMLGCIVGSAINALDWRYDNNKSWMNDRSECPHCGHTLSWWELIPVVSFFLLGRQCRECGKSISWRYPLTEIASGLLFVLIFQQFGISLVGVFSVIIWSLLLFIYVHDGRTMIIPRWAVWLFNGFAFVSLFLLLPADSFGLNQIIVTTPNWLEILSGPIIAFPFVAIWLFSGGKAMGLGDGKLALGMGWLLNITEAVSAVMLAFWIGAAVSLALIGYQRLWKTNSRKQENTITMKTAVPFGPFLVLGLLIVYFSGIILL